MWKAQSPVEFHRVHRNIPTELGEGTESQTRTIRRDSRRQSNRTLMGELALIAAVVVHHPDFFVSRSITDEINLAFRDARNAPAQAEDNLICKLVCDHPGGFTGCNVA